MKKFKEWLKKHEKIINAILDILLALSIFFAGLFLGSRYSQTPTASADESSSIPNQYHYPLTVSVKMSDYRELLNFRPNSVFTFSMSDYYDNYDIQPEYSGGGGNASIKNRYNQRYANEVTPITLQLTGSGSYYADGVFFERIEFTANYFQYYSAPLLSLTIPEGDIYNGYAFYVSDDMQYYIDNVYVSYRYNVPNTDNIINVVNSPIQSIELNDASIPDRNIFKLLPYPYIGSPNYEGVHMYDPFANVTQDILNIYDYRVVFDFNTALSGGAADDGFVVLEYVSLFVDYDVSLPTQIITNVNWFDSIVSSVDSVLSIEILPGVSFYSILVLTICIPLLVIILKAWLGG